MSIRPMDENDCIICGAEVESTFYCAECYEEEILNNDKEGES